VADRVLWEQAAMGDNDPFATAPGAHLAKATLNGYLFAWRRFLGFLAIDEPTALEIGPAERLTVERVQRFAKHLAETNIPRSVAGTVKSLYLAALVMLPRRDWHWLKAIVARLYATAPTHVSARPVITSTQLLDLGQQLMEKSVPAADAPNGKRDAVRYRDGLMIALLAFIPLRRKNLAALEIGRHLVKEGDGWFVVIPREEVKTGVPIEFPVPNFLNAYFATYLDVIRPRLLKRQNCAALWVSSRGGALPYRAIGDIVSQHTMKQLGLRITPHDARDAAATTWAISAPCRIGIARDLLSHSDLRTTTKYYNRARGIEASRAYSRIIAAMRSEQTRRRG
jgi:integrase